jgi:hypothetical protein
MANTTRIGLLSLVRVQTSSPTLARFLAHSVLQPSTVAIEA